MVAKNRILDRSGSGQSFFSFVQSQLQNKCKGRLLSLILRELGRHEPGAFIKFIGQQRLAAPLAKAIRDGSAQFETEYVYYAGRRADLAVLMDGEPSLLIEVKEDDVRASGNSEQFDDYVSYVLHKKSSAHFAHVSRYSPLGSLTKFEQLKSSGKVHDLRYRDLYASIISFEASAIQHTPLAVMVREYLEDIGVDAYKAVDLEKERNALTFLVTQMAGFDHFHSLGRLQSAANAALAPDILRRLLGNAAVLGEWLYEANTTLIGQRPKHRFVVDRRYAPRQLALAAKTPDDDDLASVSSKAVKEGTLSVYASASLRNPKGKHGGWVYVSVGQYITVSAAEREKAQFALYAQIFWKDENIYKEGEDWFSVFPPETEATTHLNALLTQAVKKAKKIDGYPSVLDQFQVPTPRS